MNNSNTPKQILLTRLQSNETVSEGDITLCDNQLCPVNATGHEAGDYSSPIYRPTTPDTDGVIQAGAMLAISRIRIELQEIEQDLAIEPIAPPCTCHTSRKESAA